MQARTILFTVATTEFVYLTGSIKHLLLTGIERVAFGAYV